MSACGDVASGRRGLPVWGKLLLMLLLGMLVVVFFAVNKPSEAELRQAIRDTAKKLQAKGVMSPLLLMDDPQHAGRFTYHVHLLSSEIKFAKVDGEVITVARGQIGGITVAEKW
jgi:hypothetical protein